MEVAKFTIQNVSLASAGDEGSYELPANTRGFWLRFRNDASQGQVAVDEGQSDVTYVKVGQGRFIKEEVKFGGATLYFQSDTDTDVVEILSFQ